MRAHKLFLIFALLIAASFCLCASKAPTPTPTPTPTPKATPKATPTPTPTPKPKAPTKVSAEKIRLVDGECLRCHNNPSKKMAYPQALSIPGHINGTKYCIYCHVPNVTKLSKEQIEEYILKLHHSTVYAKEGKCSYCHKTTVKGPLTCGDCHDNGNLLAIHSPHNVGCEACHGNDFIRIHVEKKPFPPQFPIPTKKEEQKGWV